MDLKVLLVFVGCVYVSEAVKCHQCTSVDSDCNSGDCQGNWCVARYVLVPQDGGTSKRVAKTCEDSNPNSLTDNGCIQVISESLDSKSCACQQDYCNDDGAVKKLPVQVHGNAAAAATAGTVQKNTTNGPTLTETLLSAGANLTAKVKDVFSGTLRCQCTEGCTNNECTGGACLTEIYDEVVTPTSRLATRTHKACAPTMPPQAVVTEVRSLIADGKPVSVNVKVVACNDRNFCNGATRPQAMLALAVAFLFAFFAMRR